MREGTASELNRLAEQKKKNIEQPFSILIRKMNSHISIVMHSILPSGDPEKKSGKQ